MERQYFFLLTYLYIVSSCSTHYRVILKNDLILDNNKMKKGMRVTGTCSCGAFS